MKYLWLLFIFLSFAAFSKNSQNKLRFQSITTEQGLPHNFVHALTQDEKGFIWIGTNYGLARYDGYDFKVFQPDPLKPYSITHKPIGNVFLDSDNNLWLSINSGGVNRMDLKTERFTGYFFDGKNKRIISDEKKVFLEDAEKRLWMASLLGIFLYNKITDEFDFIASSAKNTDKNYGFLCMTDDQMGNLWFINGGKIEVLNKNSKVTVSFEEWASEPKLNKIEFNNIIPAGNGKIWFCTNKHGVILYDIENKQTTSFMEKEQNIKNLFQDESGNLFTISHHTEKRLNVLKKSDFVSKAYSSFLLPDNPILSFDYKMLDDTAGNIWIVGGDGLGKFNFENGLTTLITDPFSPNTISANKIDNIFIDRTNNLWLCPNRKGLNKADLNQKPFYLYEPEIKVLEDILSDKNVSSVFEDSKGNLWMGLSNYGVSIFSKKENKWLRYYINSYYTITSIHEDRIGNFWLGTYQGELYKIHAPEIATKTPGKIQYFNKVENIPCFSVRDFAQDQSNNLWLASGNGLIEINPKTNAILNHSALHDSLNNYSTFYRTVYIDKNGIIWTGSNHGGLCRYNASKNEFKHYLKSENSNESISNNTVYAIYEDKEGVFWIGTGQGLNQFNPNTEKFTTMGEGLELFKRSIFSILPDTFGNLWMSTDLGIIKYNIQSSKSIIFDRSDGLQSEELNTTASFINQSGELFFGGSKGLITFSPSEIKTNPLHAKPALTNFLVHNKIISPGDSLNGRVLLQKQVWETNKISLFHYEADFIIEFSALHFSAPEKNKFQYKLEGFNNDWVYTDASKRYASYTGLPPGDYTFVLKATNNDGLLCLEQDEVRILITIIPAFWQTLWFKIVIFLFLVGITVLLVAHRIQTLRKINKSLDGKVKKRTIELETANTYLENMAIELEESNAILEDRQEEINIQKEEIEKQYYAIKDQHDKIINQNIELDNHRNKLEFLVEERTKELEEALLKAEQSDKLKTSFLTNMSHEIRTPMNAIIGFSSLLRDIQLTDFKRDEYVNIIEKNGQSLLTLINDILELSSIQSQHISLKPQNNNLKNTLSQIFDIFKYEAQNKKLTFKLETNLISDNYYLKFDEVRLNQVLSNLLSNALKFTENGSVEFGISKVDSNITFFVKDSGIGINDEFSTSIFERFFKIENHTNQLYRGTGLGLAISKSIVTLWGGEIWFESEVGKGTVFYFTIPINSNNPLVYKSANNLIINNINISDTKILIVEDEESNFKLLEGYLKPSKAKLTWAKNGLEAIEYVKNNEYNIVLMDIKMPIMNGMDASKRIKSLFPQLPIIAQTAYAFKNEIEEIMESGFDAYIVKPINRNELIFLINKYLK